MLVEGLHSRSLRKKKNIERKADKQRKGGKGEGGRTKGGRREGREQVREDYSMKVLFHQILFNLMKARN